MAAPRSIVIAGGGIVGASTAYYLTRHPALAGAAVHLFEGTEIAAGASGKSGGFLASDWHGPATENLGLLSYSLHAQLASEHGGAERWGYRPVTALSLLADTSSPTSKNPRKGAAHLKEGALDWLDASIVSAASVLGTPDTVAQAHPRLLTQALVELAQERGAQVHVAHVEEVRRDKNGSIKEVVGRTRDGEEIAVPATDLVITAGPWSGALAQKLLPAKDARKIAITGSRAHSIVVRPPADKPLSAHCLFTEVKIRKAGTVSPEVYCRPDKSAYICGPTDSSPLPPTAADVRVVPSSIASLKEQAALLSPTHFALTASSPVEAEQACYLPVSAGFGGGPVVGWLSEGVYVGAGHSCWGISLGPGTGKVLSEVILEGKAKSADISKLEP